MKVIIDIPENATIREILEATLKATDYNGLRGDECGCLEGDLLLCNGGCDGLIDPDCQLGYVHWCKDCTKKTDCETYDEVKDCDPSVHCCVKLDKQKKKPSKGVGLERV